LFVASLLAFRGAEHEHAALLIPAEDHDQVLGIGYAVLFG